MTTSSASLSTDLPHGPLHGLRVLDLSRVLAGPSATQVLGDLGAEVIKIEKPGAGDDTRAWGPPYVTKPDGTPSSESAYYLSANRNKKSVTIDFHTEDGRALVLALLADCDILVENFKTGSLDKYGLGYDQIKERFPRLIYCSITGFGHTGPMKHLAGYDFMVQGMGGIMALTGPVDGMPHKVGVAIADLMTGMYALTGILAAVHARTQTGRGQFVDVALLDTQLAWLSNAGQYYLTSGKNTPRYGNAHPSIVPYQVFETADGHMVLAVGNDKQFRIFCEIAGVPALADDIVFATNPARVTHRDTVCAKLSDIMRTRTTDDWINALEPRGVPCGPVNSVTQAFAMPQADARDMVIEMPHPDSDTPQKLIGSPLKFSATPVTYRDAPPKLGQHTHDVLRERLSLDTAQLGALEKAGVI